MLQFFMKDVYKLLKWNSVLALLILIPIITNAQSKLPPNITSSKCVMGVECSESEYEKILALAKKGLAQSGISVDYSFFIHSNQRLKTEEFKKVNADIENGDYNAWISIGTTFNSLYNTYTWTLYIAELDGKINMYKVPKRYYLVNSGNFEKVFNKLEKSVAKLNK